MTTDEKRQALQSVNVTLPAYCVANMAKRLGIVGGRKWADIPGEDIDSLYTAMSETYRSLFGLPPLPPMTEEEVDARCEELNL